MGLAITRGKISRPVKVLIYGPEGIGKSTFGSKLPNPLFIDAEDGTSQLDVARTKPTSWAMAKAIVEELTRSSEGFKTLVIDTADWLEKLCVAEILANRNAQNLALVGRGYGEGYSILAEEWKKFLDMLSLLQEKQGMHVVFFAHSKIAHTNIPTESGEFDRYTIRMNEKASAPLREWVDAQFFINYKTYIETDKEGKARAVGGKDRVLHTQHNACWDAKNRFDLPDELPLDFAKIAHVFSAPMATPAAAPAATQEKKAEPANQEASQSTTPASQPAATQNNAQPGPLPDCIPKELRDLMLCELTPMTVEELMASVSGSYPLGTPVQNVPRDWWLTKAVPNFKSRILPVVEAYRKNKAAKK